MSLTRKPTIEDVRFCRSPKLKSYTCIRLGENFKFCTLDSFKIEVPLHEIILQKIQHAFGVSNDDWTVDYFLSAIEVPYYYVGFNFSLAENIGQDLFEPGLCFFGTCLYWPLRICIIWK